MFELKSETMRVRVVLFMAIVEFYLVFSSVGAQSDNNQWQPKLEDAPHSLKPNMIKVFQELDVKQTDVNPIEHHILGIANKILLDKHFHELLASEKQMNKETLSESKGSDIPKEIRPLVPVKALDKHVHDLSAGEEQLHKDTLKENKESDVLNEIKPLNVTVESVQEIRIKAPAKVSDVSVVPQVIEKLNGKVRKSKTKQLKKRLRNKLKKPRTLNKKRQNKGKVTKSKTRKKLIKKAKRKTFKKKAKRKKLKKKIKTKQLKNKAKNKKLKKKAKRKNKLSAKKLGSQNTKELRSLNSVQKKQGLKKSPKNRKGLKSKMRKINKQRLNKLRLLRLKRLRKAFGRKAKSKVLTTPGNRAHKQVRNFNIKKGRKKTT